jgi:hypothetical protein
MINTLELPEKYKYNIEEAYCVICKGKFFRKLRPGKPRSVRGIVIKRPGIVCCCPTCSRTAYAHRSQIYGCHHRIVIK